MSRKEITGSKLGYTYEQTKNGIVVYKNGKKADFSVFMKEIKAEGIVYKGNGVFKQEYDLDDSANKPKEYGKKYKNGDKIYTIVGRLKTGGRLLGQDEDGNVRVFSHDKNGNLVALSESYGKLVGSKTATQNLKKFKESKNKTKVGDKEYLVTNANRDRHGRMVAIDSTGREVILGADGKELNRSSVMEQDAKDQYNDFVKQYNGVDNDYRLKDEKDKGKTIKFGNETYTIQGTLKEGNRILVTDSKGNFRVVSKNKNKLSLLSEAYGKKVVLGDTNAKKKQIREQYQTYSDSSIVQFKDEDGKVYYFDTKTGKKVADYAQKEANAIIANLEKAAKGLGTDEELLEEANNAIKDPQVRILLDKHFAPYGGLRGFLDSEISKNERNLYELTQLENGAITAEETKKDVLRNNLDSGKDENFNKALGAVSEKDRGILTEVITNLNKKYGYKAKIAGQNEIMILLCGKYGNDVKKIEKALTYLIDPSEKTFTPEERARMQAELGALWLKKCDETKDFNKINSYTESAFASGDPAVIKVMSELQTDDKKTYVDMTQFKSRRSQYFLMLAKPENYTDEEVAKQAAMMIRAALFDYNGYTKDEQKAQDRAIEAFNLIRNTNVLNLVKAELGKQFDDVAKRVKNSTQNRVDINNQFFVNSNPTEESTLTEDEIKVRQNSVDFLKKFVAVYEREFKMSQGKDGWKKKVIDWLTNGMGSSVSLKDIDSYYKTVKAQISKLEQGLSGQLVNLKGEEVTFDAAVESLMGKQGLEMLQNAQAKRQETLMYGELAIDLVALAIPIPGLAVGNIVKMGATLFKVVGIAGKGLKLTKVANNISKGEKVIDITKNVAKSTNTAIKARKLTKAERTMDIGTKALQGAAHGAADMAIKTTILDASDAATSDDGFTSNRLDEMYQKIKSAAIFGAAGGAIGGAASSVAEIFTSTGAKVGVHTGALVADLSAAVGIMAHEEGVSVEDKIEKYLNGQFEVSDITMFAMMLFAHGQAAGAKSPKTPTVKVNKDGSVTVRQGNLIAKGYKNGEFEFNGKKYTVGRTQKGDFVMVETKPETEHQQTASKNKTTETKSEQKTETKSEVQNNPTDAEVAQIREEIKNAKDRTDFNAIRDKIKKMPKSEQRDALFNEYRNAQNKVGRDSVGKGIVNEAKLDKTGETETGAPTPEELEVMNKESADFIQNRKDWVPEGNTNTSQTRTAQQEVEAVTGLKTGVEVSADKVVIDGVEHKISEMALTEAEPYGGSDEKRIRIKTKNGDIDLIYDSEGNFKRSVEHHYTADGKRTEIYRKQDGSLDCYSIENNNITTYYSKGGIPTEIRTNSYLDIFYLNPDGKPSKYTVYRDGKTQELSIEQAFKEHPEFKTALEELQAKLKPEKPTNSSHPEQGEVSSETSASEPPVQEATGGQQKPKAQAKEELYNNLLAEIEDTDLSKGLATRKKVRQQRSDELAQKIKEAYENDQLSCKDAKDLLSKLRNKTENNGLDTDTIRGFQSEVEELNHNRYKERIKKSGGFVFDKESASHFEPVNSETTTNIEGLTTEDISICGENKFSPGYKGIHFGNKMILHTDGSGQFQFTSNQHTKIDFKLGNGIGIEGIELSYNPVDNVSCIVVRTSGGRGGAVRIGLKGRVSQADAKAWLEQCCDTYSDKMSSEHIISTDTGKVMADSLVEYFNNKKVEVNPNGNSKQTATEATGEPNTKSIKEQVDPNTGSTGVKPNAAETAKTAETSEDVNAGNAKTDEQAKADAKADNVVKDLDLEIGYENGTPNGGSISREVQVDYTKPNTITVDGIEMSFQAEGAPIIKEGESITFAGKEYKYNGKDYKYIESENAKHTGAEQPNKVTVEQNSKGKTEAKKTERKETAESVETPTQGKTGAISPKGDEVIKSLTKDDGTIMTLEETKAFADTHKNVEVISSPEVSNYVLKITDEHGNTRQIEISRNNSYHRSNDEVFFVDENGKVTFSHEFEHDVNGRVTKEINKDANGKKSLTEYKYDAEGNKTETVFKDDKGNKTRSEEYKYDAANRPSEIVYKDANGNVTCSEKYTYHDNGEWSRETVYRDNKGGVSNSIEYKCNANSRPTEIVYRDANGKVTSSKEYKYDADGKVTSSEEYKYDADSNTSQIIYRDADGKVTSSEKYKYDADGKITSSTEYKYDADGNTSQIIYRDADYNITEVQTPITTKSRVLGRKKEYTIVETKDGIAVSDKNNKQLPKNKADKVLEEYKYEAVLEANKNTPAEVPETNGKNYAEMSEDALNDEALSIIERAQTETIPEQEIDALIDGINSKGDINTAKRELDEARANFKKAPKSKEAEEAYNEAKKKFDNITNLTNAKAKLESLKQKAPRDNNPIENNTNEADVVLTSEEQVKMLEEQIEKLDKKYNSLDKSLKDNKSGKSQYNKLRANLENKLKAVQSEAEIQKNVVEMQKKPMTLEEAKDFAANHPNNVKVEDWGDGSYDMTITQNGKTQKFGVRSEQDLYIYNEDITLIHPDSEGNIYTTTWKTENIPEGTKSTSTDKLPGRTVEITYLNDKLVAKSVNSTGTVKYTFPEKKYGIGSYTSMTVENGTAIYKNEEGVVGIKTQATTKSRILHRENKYTIVETTKDGIAVYDKNNKKLPKIKAAEVLEETGYKAQIESNQNKSAESTPNKKQKSQELPKALRDAKSVEGQENTWTRDVLDSDGKPIKGTDGKSIKEVIKYSHFSKNHVGEYIDAEGNTHINKYDKKGNLTKETITNSDGTKSEEHYKNGRRTVTETVNGKKTVNEYAKGSKDPELTIKYGDAEGKTVESFTTKGKTYTRNNNGEYVCENPSEKLDLIGDKKPETIKVGDKKYTLKDGKYEHTEEAKLEGEDAAKEIEVDNKKYTLKDGKYKSGDEELELTGDKKPETIKVGDKKYTLKDGKYEHTEEAKLEGENAAEEIDVNGKKYKRNNKGEYTTETAKLKYDPKDHSWKVTNAKDKTVDKNKGVKNNKVIDYAKAHPIKTAVIAGAGAGAAIYGAATLFGDDGKIEEPPAEIVAELDEDEAPTEQPADGSEADAPTEQPADGSEADAPTEQPADGSEADAPTEQPADGSEADAPTEQPPASQPVSGQDNVVINRGGDNKGNDEDKPPVQPQDQPQDQQQVQKRKQPVQQPGQGPQEITLGNGIKVTIDKGANGNPVVKDRNGQEIKPNNNGVYNIDGQNYRLVDQGFEPVNDESEVESDTVDKAPVEDNTSDDKTQKQEDVIIPDELNIGKPESQVKIDNNIIKINDDEIVIPMTYGEAAKNRYDLKEQLNGSFKATKETTNNGKFDFIYGENGKLSIIIETSSSNGKTTKIIRGDNGTIKNYHEIFKLNDKEVITRYNDKKEVTSISIGNETINCNNNGDIQEQLKAHPEFEAILNKINPDFNAGTKMVKDIDLTPKITNDKKDTELNNITLDYMIDINTPNKDLTDKDKMILLGQIRCAQKQGDIGLIREEIESFKDFPEKKTFLKALDEKSRLIAKKKSKGKNLGKLEKIRTNNEGQVSTETDSFKPVTEYEGVLQLKHVSHKKPNIIQRLFGKKEKYVLEDNPKSNND